MYTINDESGGNNNQLTEWVYISTSPEFTPSQDVSGVYLVEFFYNEERLLGNVCFVKNTPITTDQGDIEICKVNTDMTINGKPIIGISNTINTDSYLVCFEENSISDNLPSNKTIMSGNHIIFYNNKAMKAVEFINKYDNIYKIDSQGDLLYNILMEEYDKMYVNNLHVETLNPINDISKLTLLKDMPKNIRDNIYKTHNIIYKT